MIFSSIVFLFLFLPCVLILYFLIPRQFKNIFLLLASLFFYAWGEGLFVLIMLLSIAVNYLSGILIDRYRNVATVKWILAGAIGINLSFLAIYKYANFLVDNLNELLSIINMSSIIIETVHLPIGISFFTFQAISYLIDVYQEKAPVQKNPINIALYIALFPQLIAGPIVRYHDIARQIVSRVVSLEDFACGVERFIWGLAKKILIANTLAGVADQIFALPGQELTASLAWFGLVCYSLQIYFDFSAYSDMAIGLGRMFGFRFLENFNYPYIARSIQDFWKRWHISLSCWFRDYLYIPLGGNRCAPWRVYLNLLTVFFLCGLWHGASWNFIIWGLLHGSFLIIERLGFNRLLAYWWYPLSHVYVLFVVMISWVFFRIEDFPTALQYLKALFGFGEGLGIRYHIDMYFNVEILLFLCIAFLGSMPLMPYLSHRWKIYYKKSHHGIIWHIAISSVHVSILLSILLLSFAYLASGTYNPFIYFRF